MPLVRTHQLITFIQLLLVVCIHIYIKYYSAIMRKYAHWTLLFSRLQFISQLYLFE